MNVIEVFGCERCGDVTLRARLHGVLGADESGTVGMTAHDVEVAIDIVRHALAGSGAKLRVGTCWACLTDQDVSRETLSQDAVADDSEDVSEEDDF